MNPDGDLYPWQDQAWKRALAMRSRLDNALLLAAPRETGLERFASAVIAMMLCRAPQPPCGQCSDCRQLNVGEHRDLLRIGLEEKATQIKAEQIRNLIHFAQTTPLVQGGRRVCFISPAEAMNRSAANILLKTLEDPPGNAFILLASHQPGALLPTIRSRCQKLFSGLPHTDASLQWLRERIGEREGLDALLAAAGKAPLRALKSHESGNAEHQRQCLESCSKLLADQIDPMDVVDDWQAWGAEEAMEWLLDWFAALLRRRLAGLPLPLWRGGRNAEALADSLSPVGLHAAHACMLKTWLGLRHSANYSERGLLEDLALFLYTLALDPPPIDRGGYTLSP